MLCAVSAGATLVMERGLDQLTREAQVVVHGRVVQLEVDGATGYRTAVVESLDVAKAPAEFERQHDFYVPLVNRALPHSDLVEVVAQAPELQVGEEVLLFLDPVTPKGEGNRRRLDGRRLFNLSGFYQGKNLIYSDAQGVRRVVTHRDLAPVELTGRQLQLQRSTARLRAKVLPQSLPSEARTPLRSLDEILNMARASANAAAGGR